MLRRDVWVMRQKDECYVIQCSYMRQDVYTWYLSKIRPDRRHHAREHPVKSYSTSKMFALCVGDNDARNYKYVGRDSRPKLEYLKSWNKILALHQNEQNSSRYWRIVAVSLPSRLPSASSDQPRGGQIRNIGIFLPSAADNEFGSVHALLASSSHKHQPARVRPQITPRQQSTDRRRRRVQSGGVFGPT